MRSLPTWAVYSISGLACLVMILAGTTGTLLLNDRSMIKESFTEIKGFMQSQTKINQEIMEHNREQNHIMEKICVALSMDHKQRMEVFKNYPLMPNYKVQP